MQGTIVPVQNAVIRSHEPQTEWPGNNTGTPGDSPPGRGRPLPAGSSSQPALPQPQYRGRHAASNAEPYCNPMIHTENSDYH